MCLVPMHAIHTSARCSRTESVLIRTSALFASITPIVNRIKPTLMVMRSTCISLRCVYVCVHVCIYVCRNASM